MKKDTPEKAAKLFWAQFEERMHLDNARQHRHEKIINEKSHELIPLRMLLKKIVDAGVYVTHYALHDPGSMAKTYAPQAFEVWEDKSSPKWEPGISLFLDHPAKIEIAIPNPAQKTEYGVVAIMCSTDHPHAHLLKGPFIQIEDACLALAQFLSLSTLRVERPSLLQD